jgi:hypothetical protein
LKFYDSGNNGDSGSDSGDGRSGIFGIFFDTNNLDMVMDHDDKYRSDTYILK